MTLPPTATPVDALPELGVALEVVLPQRVLETASQLAELTGQLERERC